jgi:UDP-glucose 6-dehydrogenase
MKIPTLGGMAKKMIDAVGGSAADTAVGVFGVPFKSTTDGARVRAFDPDDRADAQPPPSPSVHRADDAPTAPAVADVAVLWTECEQFRPLALERIRSLVSDEIRVDLHDVHDAPTMRVVGFARSGIGFRPAGQ